MAGGERAWEVPVVRKSLPTIGRIRIRPRVVFAVERVEGLAEGGYGLGIRSVALIMALPLTP